MASVLFFSEGIDFRLSHPRKTSSWIKLAIQKEKRLISSLNFIFTTDSVLAPLNVIYLNHNTLTDIITFDYSNERRDIIGDVYISIDRVRENAAKFSTDFDEELHRVIIHGVLHLVGYNDKNASERAQIRKKEEAYLSLRS
jgi:probable rRNA maturation factor